MTCARYWRLVLQRASDIVPLCTIRSYSACYATSSWRALFCRDKRPAFGPVWVPRLQGTAALQVREDPWSFDKDLEGVRSLGAALVDASLFGRKGMSERAKNLEGEAVAPPGASRMPSKRLCSPRERGRRKQRPCSLPNRNKATAERLLRNTLGTHLQVSHGGPRSLQSPRVNNGHLITS